MIAKVCLGLLLAACGYLAKAEADLVYRFLHLNPGVGGFEALDLLHSPESEPNPRLEERSRRFVLTVHRVVAGEFGKLFLYRTWGRRARRSSCSGTTSTPFSVTSSTGKSPHPPPASA